MLQGMHPHLPYSGVVLRVPFTIKIGIGLEIELWSMRKKMGKRFKPGCLGIGLFIPGRVKVWIWPGSFLFAMLQIVL